MILYPTETLYALGVDPFNELERKKLYELKDRDTSKPSSWLVRSLEDIKRYALVPESAERIAQAFLPGSLTLVLRAKEGLPAEVLAADRTVAFRISSDPLAQKLIAEFMDEHDAPLTCTSANVSGSPTLPTVAEILQQFGAKAKLIDAIIDDGPRKGLASTIVRVLGEAIDILREGEISEKDVHNALR